MSKRDGSMKASGEFALESMGHPRTAAASDERKGRKMTPPDSVFERLVLTAPEHGSAASAIAAGILDRNLPRLRIAADD